MKNETKHDHTNRPGDFNELYPYPSQQACKDAIREQGLTNHYASGGRRNNVERYQIAEWAHVDKTGIAPAHKRKPTDPSTDAPVAKRKSGAMSVCAEVFETHNTSKAAFVDECTKRGVFPGTSKARWSDLVRKAKH